MATLMVPSRWVQMRRSNPKASARLQGHRSVAQAARPVVARLVVALAVLAGMLVTSPAEPTGPSEATAATTRVAGPTVWVARSGCKNVARVTASGRVVARVDVGCQVRAVAVGAGAVWFTTDSASVVRVDPSSNEVVATIPVGTLVGVVSATDNAVWVTAPETHEVIRIDPSANAVVARIPVGTAEACPTWLTADTTSVLVVLYDLGVARIDPATNTIVAQTSEAQGKACRPATATLASGHGWILDTFTGALLALDAKSLATTTTRQLGAGQWQIASDGNVLWALDSTHERLVRIDPADGAILRRVSTRARQAQHLVVAADSAWFYDGKAIVRVPNMASLSRTRIEMAIVNAFAVSR
jgi:hypothetical protein